MRHRIAGQGRPGNAVPTVLSGRGEAAAPQCAGDDERGAQGRSMVKSVNIFHQMLPRPSLLRVCGLCCSLITPVAAILGQPPSKPNAAAPQSVEKPIPSFERGGGEPVVPSAAGAGQGVDSGADASIDIPLNSLPPDFNIPGAQLLAEGTYVPRIGGRVVKTTRGEIVFAPDTQQEGGAAAGLPSPLPLMVLLPSVRRDQLSAAMEDGIGADAKRTGSTSIAASDRAVLGGQVYVYHGRSYLLCSTFSSASTAPKSKDPQSPQRPEKPAASPAAPSAPERPGVQELIHELEKSAEEQRALTPGTRRRVSEDDSVAAAISEGSVVSNRRGRLVRLTDERGRLAFVVDNDPDSPALPALVMVPCQMLEQIEGVVAARGPEISVKMSGRVLTSNNKAMLLPVFFQVERRTDVTPGQ